MRCTIGRVRPLESVHMLRRPRNYCDIIIIIIIIIIVISISQQQQPFAAVLGVFASAILRPTFPVQT